MPSFYSGADSQVKAPRPCMVDYKLFSVIGEGGEKAVR